MDISTIFKRKAAFSLFMIFLAFSGALAGGAKGEVADKCPGADAPPPPILDPDLSRVVASLEALKDSQGRSVWTTTSEDLAELQEIFFSTPRKTKLEQFFQLLFAIQKRIDASFLPVAVDPPGITEVLLAARVFTDPSFPKQITRVELKRDGVDRPPIYRVQFALSEVRFPINQGKGFATWDQGMCQVAKELVFYPGFSFRVRTARNSKNLVVNHFDKVEIFGEFGTRKVFKIDLNYVDLEKVEFIQGTDQGKVKARVARREFRENKHSRLFKFIGTMIPNTSKQRIDW